MILNIFHISSFQSKKRDYRNQTFFLHNRNLIFVLEKVAFAITRRKLNKNWLLFCFKFAFYTMYSSSFGFFIHLYKRDLSNIRAYETCAICRLESSTSVSKNVPKRKRSLVLRMGYANFTNCYRLLVRAFTN